MDWKRYYRGELESSEGKRLVEELFHSFNGGDEGLIRVLQEGGVVSFPHTALRYSGPLIMRTVASLLHLPELRRTIALGVLHTGTLPEPYAELYRRAQEGGEGWERLAGGFVPPGEAIRTPFGEVPLAHTPVQSPLQRGGAILAHEFSLDTFFSLYAYAAGKMGMKAPPVLPIYVGMTRNPHTDSFQTAAELARAIAAVAGPGTAVVATGDVVHYGLPYGDHPGSDGLPRDSGGLARHFRTQVERTLKLALAGDHGAAFALLEKVLKSDQRYLLPVIAELLGTGARFEVLEFELSDYSWILEVAPPCVVASSLIAFRPRG